MKIVICEDDALHRSMIENYVKKAIITEKLSCKIDLSTDNPKLVLDYINKMEDILFFLDVEYAGSSITGIELASELRKVNPHFHIVLITSHSEAAMEAYKYKLQLLSFLNKSNIELFPNEIRSCIMTAIERSRKPSYACLQIRLKTNTYIIPYRDILFIETIKNSHNVVIHKEFETHNIAISLGEIEKMITDKDFVRASKSAIVNKEKILFHHDKEIHFINGVTIPFSRTFYKPFTTNRQKAKLINLSYEDYMCQNGDTEGGIG